MCRPVTPLFALAIASVLVASAWAAESTPPSALDTNVAALAVTNSEAAKCFVSIKNDADAALHDKPNPIKMIISEGHLGSDPDRIRTYKSLPDIDKIDSLRWAWVVTRQDKYRDKLHDFLMAWAAINNSKGDPIDDTKLEAAFAAYGDVRPTFSDADRKVADGWLMQTAHALIDFYGKRTDVMKNNWESHRLKMVGLVAFLLNDSDMKAYVIQRYKDHIQENLLPSGSSIDFEDRDALHYHIYDLEPLLALAILADQNGTDLYNYVAPSGASLPKSLAWLIPFADGSKPHAEFVKSKVDFDRKRAAAGDSHYKAGTLFEPSSSLLAIELGTYFDANLLPLANKLADSSSARFGTWDLVTINAYPSTTLHQGPTKN